MPDYITIDEQERQGLRRPVSQYVTPYHHQEITTNERGVIGSALDAAGTVMSHRQMSHLAKSEDTALTTAFASLFYSLAYGVAGAMITGPLVLLAFWALGGDEEIYYVVFLLLWGMCILAALGWNRWQGLWYSPAGLDHHEIDSRERIAMFAIEKHVELLEKKWGVK
jgi:hypothetical protein